MIKIIDDKVFFFHGPLSNFWRSPFKAEIEEGKCLSFSSVEQFFMFMKALTFQDFEMTRAILQATTPQKAKRLGRSVKGYKDDEWARVRYDIMLRGNYLKYTRNKDCYAFLMNSEYDGKKFVEASPFDMIWGIGMNIDDPNITNESLWKGQNLMGKVLDEVRRRLKKEEEI